MCVWRRRLLASVGALLATSSGIGRADAQVDVQTFHPSTDPSAGLGTESVGTQGAGNWNVATWVGIEDAQPGHVDLQTLDFATSLGLGDRSAVGLVLPGVPLRGDPTLTGKGVIIPDEKGGFGLAALGAVTAPLTPFDGYEHEPGFRVGLRILAEYTLVVASVQASLGYLLRTEHVTYDPKVGPVFGDEIPWSFGITMKPEVLKIDPGARQRWALSVRGHLPVDPTAPFSSGAAALSPVTLALDDRIEIGHRREVYAVVGLERGMALHAWGAPFLGLVLGLGYAPRSHDADKDGVEDEKDQCPELPEDRDGFDDGDGCPDLDNDDDGVPDAEDACPDVAGPVTEDPRTLGCPSARP